MNGRVRAALLSLAAPVLAITFSIVVTSLILVATGDPFGLTWQTVLDVGLRPRSIAQILNLGTIYYLSALAVAIGFRMNLFNIGVDGQYRVAAFAAAMVAGNLSLPFPLSIVLAVIVAGITGGLWAGIAGYLKVKRGVNEVISTIMLNAIATGLVAFLLRQFGEARGNDITTPVIAEGSRAPGIDLIPGSTEPVNSLIVLAILAGIAYWIVLNRTRFGFRLRATGRSQGAAVASGIDVKRMVIISMLLSGGMAGMVGLPLVFGESYSFGLTFPGGLGFTGIAVALLGRNHPIGVAFGAVLFAYLEVAANPLQIIADVSPEIITIMQGVIVLAVVISYELVRRYRVRDEQQRVAKALAAGEGGGSADSIGGQTPPREPERTSA
ncbi:MAG: ABC transporter permease [Actinomycetota bacterium]|nr:ABC transporter permease [Actinomycetota bacterium]